MVSFSGFMIEDEDAVEKVDYGEGLHTNTSTATARKCTKPTLKDCLANIV
jgi:hypothetical protein